MAVGLAEVILLAAWLLVIWGTVKVARGKGRNRVAWGLLGGTFWVGALLVAFLIPPLRRSRGNAFRH